MGDLLLRDLPGAPPDGTGYELIERDDVFWPEQDASDEAALKTVLQDVALGESFLLSRLYAKEWQLSEILLRASVEPQKWPGTETYRSALGMPLLAEHLYSMLSAVQEGIFSGLQWFQIDPRPGTKTDTARANQALIQWELEQCNFEQEFVSLTFDSLLYGLGVGFWGWDVKTRTRREARYKNHPHIVNSGDTTLEIQPEKDEIEWVETQEEINQPKFEYVNIRHLIVDPGCRRGDIRTAKWVARRMYYSAEELDELRDYEGFNNLPSRENFELLVTPVKDTPNIGQIEASNLDGGLGPLRSSKALPRWMDSTVDPLEKGFEVIEYWTATHVFWVLERQLTIRNEAHNLGRLPFVSCPLYEAPDSLYGFGLPHFVGNFQRVMQGVVNLFLDDAALNLNGMYSRKRGLNQAAQTLLASPGKVYDVDDPEAFKPIQRQPVGPDALGIIAQCRDWAARADGMNEMTMGGNMPSSKSSVTRSATGVNALLSGAQNRMQRYIDQLSKLVFIPVIEAFMEMNFTHLRPSQIKTILSDELGHAFVGDPIQIHQGRYKVSITAGSRLQARESLSNSLPVIVNLLTSPNITQGLNIEGKKVGMNALVNMIFDATGYPGRQDIVVDMTDEDKQRMMQMNSAAQQVASQQQKIESEHNARMAEIEAEVGGRVERDLVKHKLTQESHAAGF